jgi:hypothetical protein
VTLNGCPLPRRARGPAALAAELDQGAAASSARRLSALLSFYRYCAAHDLIGQVVWWHNRVGMPTHPPTHPAHRPSAEHHSLDPLLALLAA